MCLRLLRDAKGPMRFDSIVSQVILTKGIAPDGHLRKHIADTTRAALLRMGRKGMVLRIVDVPDAWWELAR